MIFSVNQTLRIKPEDAFNKRRLMEEVKKIFQDQKLPFRIIEPAKRMQFFKSGHNSPWAMKIWGEHEKTRKLVVITLTFDSFCPGILTEVEISESK